MAKMDKLTEKKEKSLARIERLKVQKQKAEQAVFDNPDNTEAAMEAGALDMQIKAAKAAAEKAEKAIKAEKNRLDSKEYKDALKKLKGLERQAEAIREAQFEAAKNFYPEYAKWEALIKEHESLARQHDIEVLDLWNRDAIQAGMRVIKNGLDSWDAARRRIEYRKRKHPEWS
jgi:ABC-type sugar transport system ATPase subunit